MCVFVFVCQYCFASVSSAFLCLVLALFACHLCLLPFLSLARDLLCGLSRLVALCPLTQSPYRHWNCIKGWCWNVSSFKMQRFSKPALTLCMYVICLCNRVSCLCYLYMCPPPPLEYKLISIAAFQKTLVNYVSFWLYRCRCVSFSAELSHSLSQPPFRWLFFVVHFSHMSKMGGRVSFLTVCRCDVREIHKLSKKKSYTLQLSVKYVCVGSRPFLSLVLSFSLTISV